MITPKDLGKYIKEKRSDLGITQKGLAEKLHVTDKAVSKWERGVGYPDIQSIQALADTLGVSLEEMFSVSEIGKEKDENTFSISEKEPNSIQKIIDSFAEEREKYQKRLKIRKKIIFSVVVLILVFTILATCPWPTKINQTLFGKHWVETEAGTIVTDIPVRIEMNGYRLNYLFQRPKILGDIKIYYQKDSAEELVFDRHFTGKSFATGSDLGGALIQLDNGVLYYSGLSYYSKVNGYTPFEFFANNDFSEMVIMRLESSLPNFYYGQMVLYSTEQLYDLIPYQKPPIQMKTPQIEELFSLEGLPLYANDLMNLWGKTDREVFEHLGWENKEPLERASSAPLIYYVNGSVPERGPSLVMINGVISDGSIDYCGGKWGLMIAFNQEETTALGRVQYETIVEKAEDATVLMDAITSQLLETLGEPMDVAHNMDYIKLEDKEETVRNLPNHSTLMNVWNITPEGAPEGLYFRVIVLLNPYYDEVGKNQLGYSFVIRLSTTQLEAFY